MAPSIYPPSSAAQALHLNHGFAFQKYILLYEQHESLRGHLDELRPPDSFQARSRTAATSPAPSPTPAGYSPPSTPLSPRSSRSPSSSRSQAQARRSSIPAAPRRGRAMGVMSSFAGLETVTDEATLQEVAAEEERLFNVNENIKRTLTELLNGEAARIDRSLRTWLQCRLLDTEKELRIGRRRKCATAANW